MTNIDVVQILGLGVVGLGFLLACFAYRLLAKEQQKARTERSYFAIIGYMIFSFALCALGLASDFLRESVKKQPFPMISDIVKSPETNEKIRVNFANSTTGDVKIFLVDQNGALKSFGSISNNGHTEIDARIGQRWLVTDTSDRPLGLYAITNSSTYVEIATQAGPAPVHETYVALSSDDEGGDPYVLETFHLKRVGDVISGDGEATSNDGKRKTWILSGYWNNAHLVLAYRSSPGGIGFGGYFLEQISPDGQLYKGHWEGNACAKPGSNPPQRIVRCNMVLVRGAPESEAVRKAKEDFREYLSPKGCMVIKPAPEQNCPLALR